jgi:N-acylneuraminate cytidylyltransferase
MDSMVEVLALIPARGGSKVIPRKNIKLLGEFPLIGYSIAAGLNAKSITRTIVSTDDHEIAEIAKEFGAEVPFLRPEEYARDDTLDLPVFQHAIKWLSEQEGYHPDIVVQLRPTSPFRPIDLIDEAIQLYTENPEATSVRGVVPSIENPFKMWNVSPKGKMTPLLKTEINEAYNRPRQDLPTTYWQTGHIDVIRTETILGGSMSGKSIFAYHIDPRFTVDLDNSLDWQRAEEQLKSLKNEIVTPPLGLKVIPEKVSLIVLDFDGVLTDNKVYVNEKGDETVAAHRGDGMGISLIKKAGIEVVILSREKNPVVKARGDKLDVPVYQGIEAKDAVLTSIIEERGLSSEEVIYLGNDINDLSCFPLVGLAVAVADAHPEVINKAKLVLNKEGGQGAVRELCDLVINANAGRTE